MVLVKPSTEPTTEELVHKGQELLQEAVSSDNPIPALKTLGIKGVIAIEILGVNKELVEKSTQAILEKKPKTNDPKEIAKQIAEMIHNRL